jgi:hypothetical protein
MVFTAEWIRIMFFRDVVLRQWVGNLADSLKEDSSFVFKGLEFCIPSFMWWLPSYPRTTKSYTSSSVCHLKMVKLEVTCIISVFKYILTGKYLFSDC